MPHLHQVVGRDRVVSHAPAGCPGNRRGDSSDADLTDTMRFEREPKDRLRWVDIRPQTTVMGA
jgi:hypothetical protein